MTYIRDNLHKTGAWSNGTNYKIHVPVLDTTRANKSGLAGSYKWSNSCPI